jgi:hypothetical protein
MTGEAMIWLEQTASDAKVVTEGKADGDRTHKSGMASEASCYKLNTCPALATRTRENSSRIHAAVW